VSLRTRVERALQLFIRQFQRNCPKSLGDVWSVVALRTAEKGLFGPFCRPYTGQINRWSIAQINF
jgi:hypothetical protein